MSIYRPQFDSTTKETFFDSTTKEIIAGVYYPASEYSCVYCSGHTMPEYIKLSISGGSYDMSAGVCIDCGSVNGGLVKCGDRKWYNLWNFNKDFILKQFGSTGTHPCWYTLTVELATPIKCDIYNSTDGSCSGGIDETEEWSTIDLFVGVQGRGPLPEDYPIIYIEVRSIGDNYGYFMKFFLDSNCFGTVSGQCLDGVSTLNDLTANGGCAPTGWPHEDCNAAVQASDTGTATITELIDDL